MTTMLTSSASLGGILAGNRLWESLVPPGEVGAGAGRGYVLACQGNVRSCVTVRKM